MYPSLSQSEINRYSRHILLPEMGMEGQRKLKASSVLVIGTGGLGSPVSLYLAAAGVGCIGLVDYDIVEESNLQRQVIHGNDSLGERKVESARKRLTNLNPGVQVYVFDELLTSQNALQIAKPYDVIIDCTDNFPARYLINDLCVLTHKPDIYGAVFRFDGQASVFDARNGPCYRCLFPEPPPSGLYLSCSEGGVLGVLPGTIGTIQATEAIKILIGMGSSLIGRLLLYNVLDMSFESILLKKSQTCKICGPYPEITDLIDYMVVCGESTTADEENQSDLVWNITPVDLATRIKSGASILIIDVREPNELLISNLPTAVNIPLGELSEHIAEIDPSKEIVLLCRMGVRSRRALDVLTGAGFKKVRNLQGGINAWAQLVDPSMPVY